MAAGWNMSHFCCGWTSEPDYFKAARYNVTRLGYLSSKYTKVVGDTSSQGFLDIICVELHVAYTLLSREINSPAKQKFVYLALLW